MVYIGIDTGKLGALSAVDENGKGVWLIDMPLNIEGKNASGKDILNWLKDRQQYSDIFVTVEECRYTPKMNSGEHDISVMTSFAFGRNYQAVIDAVEISGLSYNLVTPQNWKSEFFLLTKNKLESVSLAMKMFPEFEHMLKGRGHKVFDGRAESLLIAEYGRRKHRGIKWKSLKKEFLHTMK